MNIMNAIEKRYIREETIMLFFIFQKLSERKSAFSN